MERRTGFREVYVLDTSAVADARLRRVFGVESQEEVVRILAGLIAKARIVFGLEVYVAPSVAEEMKRFLSSNGVSREALDELFSWVKVKPPAKYSLSIPAPVFHQYVEEVRKRMMKGLRVAEDLVRKAYREARATGHGEEGEAGMGRLIHELREKYREATRHGVVDSVEDIDTVLLALELRALLVTNDEGIKRLAESLGIRVIDPVMFATMMRSVREHARILEELLEEAGIPSGAEEG